ncbi:MAG: L-histidine N(alpha)-methyltransferase, partial [Alphaproteobacteria bacterium]|nr:L-histidine N(alpha)-methyltransferase [Alphaproteobacteria bacterium]
LPEYYPTRTERALLTGRGAEIAAELPAGAALVEYGASSEEKAALVLAALAEAGRAAACYVAIDVAEAALAAMRARMLASHPGLPVHTVVADFLHPLGLPAAAAPPRIGFFPGSTIGNLEPLLAREFLRGAGATLGAEARLLIGVDLRKDPAVLVPAYDDAAGVTAAFNRNVLVRLNREAGADFRPEAFAHRATWNAAEGRIEMHLVSTRAQVAHVAGHAIRFAAGETIHTENSYKYTPQAFRILAEGAGWRPIRLWTDQDRLFSLHLLAAGEA